MRMRNEVVTGTSGKLCSSFSPLVFELDMHAPLRAASQRDFAVFGTDLRPDITSIAPLHCHSLQEASI
jgi:hypothetical protein